MLKKILVPVDGSNLSEKVLPYALKLAARLDLQVTILKVVEGTAFLDKNQCESNKAAEAARVYLSEVSNYLTLKREPPLISSAQLQTKLLYGDPAEEICRYAHEENFDLVTMTTHGQPRPYANCVGSVTRKVLQNLTVPVLLIRPYWQKSPASHALSETLACLNEPFGKRFLANGVNLVLPLDMTDKAEASLDLSFELARKLDATLYLLKVNKEAAYPQNAPLPDPSGIPAGQSEFGKTNRQEADFYLGQIEILAEKNDVEAVKIVLYGNPATEILAFSELLEPDALIMATHALGEDRPMDFSSLTQEVMRRSHLPVFMVPLPRPVTLKV